MSIYITSDIHLPIDVHKLIALDLHDHPLQKSGILIISGDFGLLWKNNQDYMEQVWTAWLSQKNYTILFVDGNHENFYRLGQLKQVEMFGSIVGKVTDNIFHLKRGEIYTINNQKFFCFGGAQSIDRKTRHEGITIWKEEVPSYKETDYGLSNLEKHNYKVDYIVTHTMPKSILKTIKYIENDRLKDPTVDFLDVVLKRTTFKKWYCGHLHDDRSFDNNLILLYEKTVKIF